MPTPEYPSARAWLAAYDHAIHRSVHMLALQRFGVSIQDAVAVAEAEASGADETGFTGMSAEELARAAGVEPYVVRQVRAGLTSAGLAAVYSIHPLVYQLQVPRGFTLG